MVSAPSRSRRARARPTRDRQPRSRFRGWVTLIALGLVVAAASLGPETLSELLSGITFVRPPAASIAPPVAHADGDLQRRLSSVAIANMHGTVSLMVVDLHSGATAGIDPEHVLPAASLFKLPILLEVLAEQENGQLDPERRLEIRPDDWTDGSGVLQARIGDLVSVRELTRLMIQESDNIAALVLLDVVGVPSVNALAERLGLNATRLVDHRAGESGDHTTSAADMAHLLVGLTTGEVVDQRVSEGALELLELKQSVNWLGDYLPFWVKVAHKWGDLPQVRNDAGVVFTPRGDFVVAALTADDQPDEAATVIARSARATYDYLGSHPERGA